MSSFPVLNLNSDRPLIMGILNATPDSFSDGGSYCDVNKAVSHALQMVEEGADIIDIGGESTRPGAAEVDLDTELNRVIPVIEALVNEYSMSIPLSIDTSKPDVMRQAISAGATLVNDVRALQAPGAIDVCAESGVQVCLMHMQGQPKNMQLDPRYTNILSAVSGFLSERRDACIAGGILKENIILDPGFGFGKSLMHNLCLLKNLRALCGLDCPVLVGVSRKSMFQQILDAPVDQRLIGSVSAALMAADRGAAILRVHDVNPTREAIKVWQAMESVDC